VHFRCLILDGVFEAGPDETQPVRFHEARLSDADMERVQARVRQRILRGLAKKGCLDSGDAQDRAQWDNGGGFSLDASMRIEAPDRQGLDRLLRYCARPAFALERLEPLEAHRLLDPLPKPRPDGRTERLLSPLERIQRLANRVPPPRRHRRRHHGVLARPDPVWGPTADGSHGPGRAILAPRSATEITGIGRGGRPALAGPLLLGQAPGPHVRIDASGPPDLLGG
jgi:hypothetical protein